MTGKSLLNVGWRADARGGAIGPAMLDIAVLARKAPAVSTGTRTEA
jgi:hypothetical protein